MSLSALLPPIWASSEGTAADPYFSDVVNLSHFDGTNGSTTYTDNSSHAANLVNDTGSSAAISTSQAKFGVSSLHCTGPNTGGITGTQTYYQIGTNDFTWEFWVNVPSIAARQDLVFFDFSTTGWGMFINASTGKINYNVFTVAKIAGSIAVAINTWTFVAYSRIGTSGVMYVGGNNAGSWTDNTNYTKTDLFLGKFFGNDTTALAGYIDDFRFTNGVGRYSGSTCPIPSAPFPNS